MLARIEQYLADLRVRNYSPETVDHHRIAFKKWVAFCSAQGIQDVGEVTPKHLRLFQVYLYEMRKKDGKPYQVATQNGTLEVVRCLFKWAFREDLIGADPAKSIQYAKEPKRLIRTILTSTEVKRMLNAPAVDTVLGYRDRTLLECLYSTMGRRGDLARLKVADLDFEHGVVTFRQGKGAKDRAVPMGKVAARYLLHYVRHIRPRLARKRLSRSMPWFIVKKHAAAAGIAKNVFPHCFRATGLTHMLRNNANPRHLMEIAGHASMEALNSYLAVEITDLKETHARCHPREMAA
jgi:integrase/recombinase XerD